MDDERRKFLLGILAAGGSAAALPEFIEAAQTTLKLGRPLGATLLKHETIKADPFSDTHVEIEVTGTNGVRQVVTQKLTSYQDNEGNGRNWVTMQIDTFDATGSLSASEVQSSHSVSRKIDATTVEITLTTTADGKLRTDTVRGIVPSVRQTTEGLTDDEMIQKFFLSKVRGMK